MKKVLIVLSILFSTASFAQDYNSSLGLRLGGWENGVTFKTMLGDGHAFEGIFASRYGGFNITGLYEVHGEITEVEGLYWYVGGGGHIGFFDGRRHYRWDNDRNYTVIGIDGIIGLEYVLADYPFNFSIDYKPAINLIGHDDYLFWGDNGALSVRYIF